MSHLLMLAYLAAQQLLGGSLARSVAQSEDKWDERDEQLFVPLATGASSWLVLGLIGAGLFVPVGLFGPNAGSICPTLGLFVPWRLIGQ